MHIDHYHSGSFAAFNPGALRSANVANALALAGHTITIITADGDEASLRGAPDRFHLHPSVEVSAGGPRATNRLTRRFRRRINPLARGLGRDKRAELILLFGPTPGVFRRLANHARRTMVGFVIDVDEWMGPRDFSLLSWLSLYPLQYEWFMRTLPDKIDSAFAISSTMQRHLAKQGARVLVVPPLQSSVGLDGAQSVRSSGKTRLLLPGVRRGGMGKDRSSLELVSDAISLEPSLADYLIIDVVGGVEEPRAQRIVAGLAGKVELRDHGTVSWSRARQLLLEADWVVALRDPAYRRLRFAFPSKVTEALVAGTPVIANAYSDMAAYLDPDRSGILVERLAADAVAAALADAISRPLDRNVVSREARLRYSPAALSNILDQFVSQAPWAKDRNQRPTALPAPVIGGSTREDWLQR